MDPLENLNPEFCTMNLKSSIVCRILRKRKTLVAQGFQRKITAKRVMGIEPTLPAWKAGVLPLNYTRNLTIGTTRFEHATPWSQTRCSTKLSYVPLVLGLFEKAEINISRFACERKRNLPAVSVKLAWAVI